MLTGPYECQYLSAHELRHLVVVAVRKAGAETYTGKRKTVIRAKEQIKFYLSVSKSTSLKIDQLAVTVYGQLVSFHFSSFFPHTD